MNSDTLKSDFVLFFVASIWGLAFVAQRVGMDHIGPFTFNGIRFVLGCISLLPVIFLQRNRTCGKNTKGLLRSGSISGICLFAGISLQQVGLVYTTAGKAGFITGLYVVLVPLLGLVLKQDTPSKGTWLGAVLAGAGLYLLSVTQDMTIEFGDLLVLVSAVCFAFHLIIIARFAGRFNAASLCLVQCLVCSVLSLLTAVVFETFVLADILNVLVPLFYGGIMSVGVAYSLQIYGQKNSPPSHAAIILCLESLVAAIGGWIILNELLSGRAVLGCALMLAGMLVSQVLQKTPAP